MAFLDRWPEALPWAEARQRWEACLRAFKLDAADLLPIWRRTADLVPGEEVVPARAFFEYLHSLIAGMSALPRTVAERRPFARIFVTSLSGAVGQTWDGALFLDCNEGVWPHARAENPCLDDRQRSFLNGRRKVGDPALGHLLTASDRARLELGHFYEVLENCTGAFAFASVRRAGRCDSRWLPQRMEPALLG